MTAHGDRCGDQILRYKLALPIFKPAILLDSAAELKGYTIDQRLGYFKIQTKVAKNCKDGVKLY